MKIAAGTIKSCRANDAVGWPRGFPQSAVYSTSLWGRDYTGRIGQRIGRKITMKTMIETKARIHAVYVVNGCEYEKAMRRYDSLPTIP